MGFYVVAALVGCGLISIWEPLGSVDRGVLEWADYNPVDLTKFIATVAIRVMASVGVAITAAIMSVG